MTYIPKWCVLEQTSSLRTESHAQPLLTVSMGTATSDLNDSNYEVSNYEKGQGWPAECRHGPRLGARNRARSTSEMSSYISNRYPLYVDQGSCSFGASSLTFCYLWSIVMFQRFESEVVS